MITVVPQDWKVVRALLKGLGLAALVLATLSLTNPTWVPGPPPVAVTAYLGTPVLVLAGALLIDRRFPSARVPARVVAATSVVVLIANLALVVVLKHYTDEIAESAPRGCDTATECRGLASEKFPSGRPLLPTTSTVQGYRFLYAEESGRLLAFWYAAQGSQDPTLAYVISARRPGGFEPSADASAFRQTPEGVRFVERRNDTGKVTRLDYWDDKFHYALALQGGHDEYAQAMALIDSGQ